MKIDYQKILKDATFKVTRPRLAVLKTFSADCKPLNAEDIFRITKDTIDQVTIYRILKAFEEKGIIRKVDLRQVSAFYELNNHHHHITCKDCGIIENFELCKINSLSKKVLKSSTKFNTITDHSLEFFGLCKSCGRV